MNKLTSEQKRHYLIIHYAKLLPTIGLVMVLILMTSVFFATFHEKQKMERQKFSETHQLKERINNLEIKVQDLQYEKSQPVEIDLSPVQFRKIAGSPNWQMFDNDYSIGQINSSIAITPKVIKSQGNLVYIGVYSEMNNNISPITIFELSRPINILKKIWDTPENLFTRQRVYDIDICNRYLLYGQDNNMIIYDFYENKIIMSLDLGQYLKGFKISNALFNAPKSQLAFSISKTKDDPMTLTNSRLYIIDLATQQIKSINTFPENKDCYLSNFEIEPEWKCNN